MSGPNPPGPESEELEPGVEPSQSGGEFDGGDSEFGAGAGESDAEARPARPTSTHGPTRPRSPNTSAADLMYPSNLDLYDYDSYDEAAPRRGGSQHRPLAVDCRNRRDRRGDCPGSLGVAAVRPHRHDKLATPSTAPTSTPPMQDEIIVTTTPPAPPPPTSEAPPPPPPPTSEAPPPPPPPAPAPPHRPQRRLRPPRPRRRRRRAPAAAHPPGPSSTRIR